MALQDKNVYSTVTETPDTNAPREQLERMYSRYRFALGFCEGKEVLEAGCGAGQGLGYLAGKAKRVFGADIDRINLAFAEKCCKGTANVRVEYCNAENLPFQDKSFDVVILYEAIYYLSNPEKFIKEARRVLRDGGTLIICTVNKEWADFNPSPFSNRYFSVKELNSLIGHEFGKVDFYGNFSTYAKGFKDIVVSLIKRTAVSLHLMPSTMKGKQLLKRLFFGKLYPLPSVIKEGMCDYVAPVPIPSDLPNKEHKVIFAVATKKE